MLGIEPKSPLTSGTAKKNVSFSEQLDQIKIFNAKEPVSSLTPHARLLAKTTHRTSTFDELFRYSKQDETNTARFLSQNHLRNDYLSNLYHDIKNGSLNDSEQSKAIYEVFSIFKQTDQNQTSVIQNRRAVERARTEIQNHVEGNLNTLEEALNSTEFKKDGIQEATDALATFSNYLYNPQRKLPTDILEKTQQLFTSLLKITANNTLQTEEAKKHLCKMIESASVLANMEIMLPQERKDAIQNLTLSTENFVNALFNSPGMQCEEKFSHPKELFRDAVYLAVLNAGLLMCYEQKGALNKFRLLVKRSFVPFAYICTKAAGAAAGILSSATGSSLGSIMTGAFASVGAKAGLAATLGAVSVPALFFVGTGLFAIALTYGLYKAGEWARHDLKESLEQKINAKKDTLIAHFDIKTTDKTKKAIVSSEEDLIRNGFIEKAGFIQNQSVTKLKQNPAFNPIRGSTPKPKDIGPGFKSAPVQKSFLSGGLSNRAYQKMEAEYNRLETHFQNQIMPQDTDLNANHVLIKTLNKYKASLSRVQISRVKENDILEAMNTFFREIKNSLDSRNDEQNRSKGLKIGKLIYLFHNLSNHSERTSTESLIKQTQEAYALAGEIAKDLININDTSQNIPEFVKYLQFHIYSAGFSLTINHRSLGAKAKRFATVAMIPVCNMLLNTEIVATSSMATALIDSQLSSMIFTTSLALGIPFMLLGFAFSFWTARKSKIADAKGIQQLNSTVRDYVKEYLNSEKILLEEKIRNASFDQVIQKMIWQQELDQIKEKQKEMDLNSDDGFRFINRADGIERSVSPELLHRAET